MKEKDLLETRFDHVYQLLQLQQKEILRLKELIDSLNNKMAVYLAKQKNSKG